MDLDDYVDQLRSDTAELNTLYKDLLIGVTKFFRDQDAYERLAKDVIPEWWHGRGSDAHPPAG